MRFTSIATIATAAISPVLGWELTIWKEKDCWGRQGGNELMVIKGTGEMSWCAGIENDRWPSQVTDCRYFRDNGNDTQDGPYPCTGQFRTARSFVVRRGNVRYYQIFDSHPQVSDGHRCFNMLYKFPDADSARDEIGTLREGAVFRNENNRCRNAVSQRLQSGPPDEWHIRGLVAWDAPGGAKRAVDFSG
ncbi:hypothetical protein Micbo1qcDRAFT_172565 [Microdochium bolleyi]|uniref:Uncharacterized protein n=1 Tax=Microdochium bolleyi TaxID=196109 RepID=A0A136J995_9PEZI|nr:hypothetical protein Micbo1qcDRAFT_172565 [Microdochium bolleyi]